MIEILFTYETVKKDKSHSNERTKYFIPDESDIDNE